ncbi:MAG: hypothetical protein KKA54_09440 [Proteobacteria bacterium]|nr:hypothetical protein [Pseudomonadota bacterium]MBU0966590.1 hypothetical protein [Pseudomonadota bacterium]
MPRDIPVGNTFRWLDDGRWQRSLDYLDDSLVTEVRLFHPELDLELVCHDMVDFHVNVYLKKIMVHNLAKKKREVRLFFGQDLRIGGHAVGDCAYYEPDKRVLFHYKGKRWFLVSTAKGRPGECSAGLDQCAVGVKGVGDKVGTWLDAEDGELSGNPVAQGSVDSVVALHLDVPAGGWAEGWYWLAVGEDYAQVMDIQHNLCKRGADPYLTRTKDYWHLWVNKEKDCIDSLPKGLQRLYRRSLLILRAQIDNNGAILDIEFIKPHYRGLIVRAANWLLAFRDEETGLPLPSWDLWEERKRVGMAGPSGRYGRALRPVPGLSRPLARLIWQRITAAGRPTSRSGWRNISGSRMLAVLPG